MKYKYKYTDIFFITIMFIMLITFVGSVIFGYDIPSLLSKTWIIILFSVVLFKYFLKNTRLYKGMLKDRNMIKTEEEIKRKKREKNLKNLLKYL